MYWIINKNIEFWPENKRLISLKNPAQSVTLTAPASHCLVLLLEAAPELVSQQVFFKKVWEDEGILVPANTLYQNISIVRRGLRDVGETDNSSIPISTKVFVSVVSAPSSPQMPTHAPPL